MRIGDCLEELAFRLVPKGNKGRLKLVRQFCKGLGGEQHFDGPMKIQMLQAAAAIDPRILTNLPSNLKDRRQRKRIEYLQSLRDSLRTHSLREVAEALNLVKPKKIK